MNQYGIVSRQVRSNRLGYTTIVGQESRYCTYRLIFFLKRCTIFAIGIENHDSSSLNVFARDNGLEDRSDRA